MMMVPVHSNPTEHANFLGQAHLKKNLKKTIFIQVQKADLKASHMAEYNPDQAPPIKNKHRLKIPERIIHHHLLFFSLVKSDPS